MTFCNAIKVGAKTGAPPNEKDSKNYTPLFKKRFEKL